MWKIHFSYFYPVIETWIWKFARLRWMLGQVLDSLVNCQNCFYNSIWIRVMRRSAIGKPWYILILNDLNRVKVYNLKSASPCTMSSYFSATNKNKQTIKSNHKMSKPRVELLTRDNLINTLCYCLRKPKF